MQYTYACFSFVAFIVSQKSRSSVLRKCGPRSPRLLFTVHIDGKRLFNTCCALPFCFTLRHLFVHLTLYVFARSCFSMWPGRRLRFLFVSFLVRLFRRPILGTEGRGAFGCLGLASACALASCSFVASVIIDDILFSRTKRFRVTGIRRYGFATNLAAKERSSGALFMTEMALYLRHLANLALLCRPCSWGSPRGEAWWYDCFQRAR
ncbi:hypothetical protein BJ546DRAFT_690223 [Cryomyces antarcticus]